MSLRGVTQARSKALQHPFVGRTSRILVRKLGMKDSKCPCRRVESSLLGPGACLLTVGHTQQGQNRKVKIGRSLEAQSITLGWRCPRKFRANRLSGKGRESRVNPSLNLGTVEDTVVVCVVFLDLAAIQPSLAQWMSYALTTQLPFGGTHNIPLTCCPLPRSGGTP